MANFIIILVILVAAFFAIRSALSHFKGQGGCCGGGETILEEKVLSGEKIGEKTLFIDGMKCKNCQNHVQNALNKLDGVCAKVNLKKKCATVQFSREVSDDELKNAVSIAGYSVSAIKEGV